MNNGSGVVVQPVGSIYGGGGSVGRRLLNSGFDPDSLRPSADVGPMHMRANGTLLHEEWTQISQTVIDAARDELTAMRRIGESGLTIPLPNALGTTTYQWQRGSDRGPASTSMLASARSDLDQQVYDITGVPVPITRADFYLDIRMLEASRNRVQPLDRTGQVLAARKVAESLDEQFFVGVPNLLYNGFTLTGLMNHADVNHVRFSAAANVAWSHGDTTGASMLEDLTAAMQECHNDNFNGPFGLFIPFSWTKSLTEDYTANYPGNRFSRLMETPGLSWIQTTARGIADTAVVVSLQEEVVAILDGIQPQPVEWDEHGGMELQYATIAIQVPLIRSTKDGKMGACIIDTNA